VTVSLDPVRDPRWSAFIDRCPAATAFHHPAWLRLLRDQYGYAMAAACVTDADGELCGGLPFARIRSMLTGRRLVALPFTDACPPLIAAGAPPSAREELEAAVRAEQEGAGVEFEVRDWLPRLGGASGERFYDHSLDLGPDPAAVEAGFSKSQVKRGIKKAVREGVTIERTTEVRALDEFYRLHVETRRHQGVPTQPRRFIRRFEELFAEGLGFVLLARWQGKPISAAVFLAFNGTLIYKYGASAREHLPKRPNNLLFSEAIRWGCLNGMSRLDFGRTDVDNEGLRAFKRAWGADERMLAYTRLPAGARRSAVPGGSARLGFVIRRSPPLVGQMVGSVLYRHVG
jgi:CelD/BcsL family acetyltransferase involved in cellulose biosynthesis